MPGHHRTDRLARAAHVRLTGSTIRITLTDLKPGGQP
jgi:hypothetical protein